MRMQPPARRSYPREGTSGPEIVIPAHRNWIVILVLPLWLGVWSTGLAGVIRSAFLDGRGPEMPLVAVWLTAAVAGLGGAVYTWLWNAIGREIVAMRPGVLAIRRDVAGLGWTREYDLVDVKNLRVSPVPPGPFGGKASMHFWLGGPGAIAFDYGARTVRFGNGIDEAEAPVVVAEIGGGSRFQRTAA